MRFPELFANRRGLPTIGTLWAGRGIAERGLCASFLLSGPATGKKERSKPLFSAGG